MTILSKTKFRFEQMFSEICARRPRKNKKRVCIDCLKPRSYKHKFQCKNCGCTDFYVLHHQNSSFEILSSF